MFPRNELYTFSGSHLHVSFETKPLYIPTTNRIYLGNFIHTGTILRDGVTIQNGVAIFQFGTIQFPQYSQINICSAPIQLWDDTMDPVLTFDTLYR